MTAPPALALEAPDGLTGRYDVALLDLDGVVYIGAHAVQNAPEALRTARLAGMRLAFVTNNAARPPQVVAAHLRELGIAADTDEVITSAQAAASYLAGRLAPGASVLVVGTTGLYEALTERGLRPVDSADDDPVAVVQGYSPTLTWTQLAEGAVAIRRGALWVATNADPTVPSPRGPLPGNGSLVAALRHATGVSPVVTGKPDPTMHQESVRRSGARAPLVVGDRLDTDIEGATAAHCPSLLVLTGVTGPRDVLSAPPAFRPTYLSHDLNGLHEPHPAVRRTADGAACRGWTARAEGRSLQLRSDDAGHRGRTASAGESTIGASAPDLDALRALCGANWGSSDREPVDEPVVVGLDAEAERALANLGLTRP